MDTPFAVGTYPDFVLAERTAITARFVTKHNLFFGTSFSVAMAAQPRPHDGILRKIPDKYSLFPRMNGHIYKDRSIGAILAMSTKRL